MFLLPASEGFVVELPSPGISLHLVPTLDLCGLGDPPGSNAAAGLALWVTRTHKPLHHSKVEIPLGDAYSIFRKDN
jgi:hypothetical protein